jgi:hypothetical protein
VVEVDKRWKREKNRRRGIKEVYPLRDRQKKSVKERAKLDSKARGKRGGGKNPRRVGSEMPAAEEGPLVLGSGVWSALVRPSRSASKKPSKNESERMAADGALVSEGKNAEENEGSSSPGCTSGKKQGERRSERVP